MSKKRIAIIGCGNLGESILKGLISQSSQANEHICITKRNTEPIKHYEQQGVLVTSNNTAAIMKSDILVFGLKPYTILDVLKSVKASIDPERHVIVSLAAGVSIENVREVVGSKVLVYRAMPNIAATVAESLTCLATDKKDPKSFLEIERLFRAVGVPIVISESLMEAATVVGACGIAYVMRFIRAMVQGGIQIGFDAKTANEIVNQTVLGAAKLLMDSGHHPEYEIDKVTTPKGCTIVGLNQMEHSGFSSALIKGIVSSYDKIKESE